MGDRTIFNRTYTAFTPNDTTTYLLNGGLRATASGFNPQIDIIAGEDMPQGTPVYVSGSKCFPAWAGSSAQNFEVAVIGFTDEVATINAPVTIDVDGIVTIPGGQVSGEDDLTPGRPYFLSEYRGEVTSQQSASGTISRPDYRVSAPVGVAITSTSLTIEIGTPTFLV